jgi:hypothetical protein
MSCTRVCTSNSISPTPHSNTPPATIWACSLTTNDIWSRYASKHATTTHRTPLLFCLSLIVCWLCVCAQVFAQRLKLDLNEPLELSRYPQLEVARFETPASAATNAPPLTSVTVGQVLTRYWDFQCIPRRSVLRALARFATNEVERDKLEFLASSTVLVCNVASLSFPLPVPSTSLPSFAWGLMLNLD